MRVVATTCHLNCLPSNHFASEYSASISSYFHQASALGVPTETKDAWQIPCVALATQHSQISQVHPGLTWLSSVPGRSTFHRLSFSLQAQLFQEVWGPERRFTKLSDDARCVVNCVYLLPFATTNSEFCIVWLLALQTQNNPKPTLKSSLKNHWTWSCVQENIKQRATV